MTEQSLEVITKDLFSANEYMFLFPLYGWELYNKFQIKNQWIKHMKPSYALTEIEPLKTMHDSGVSKRIRNVGEFTGQVHELNIGDKLGLRGPYGRGFHIAGSSCIWWFNC